MARVPNVDDLWHYTTWRGLSGIASDHALWATHARYLTDARELDVALQLLLETLPVTDLPEWMRDALAEHARSDLASGCSVICFSTEDDDLSQWRAYGQGAHGFAIRFDAKQLAKTAGAATYRLRKCIYDRKGQAAAIAGVLSSWIDYWKRNSEESPEWTRQKWLLNCAKLARAWSLIAPELKSDAFEVEQEWRLIGFEQGSPKDWGFHQSSSLVAPHRSLHLGQPSETSIREVVIGPGPHMDLMQTSTQMFLASKDLHVPVTLSKIPFRNW